MRLAPCNHFFCPNCVKTTATRKVKPTCTGRRCRNTHNPPQPEYRLLRPADVARVEKRVFRISANNMMGHISDASCDPGLFEVVIGLWNGPKDTDLDTVRNSSCTSTYSYFVHCSSDFSHWNFTALESHSEKQLRSDCLNSKRCPRGWRTSDSPMREPNK